MTDSNGPARRAAQGALYYLLSFHHGSDRAEKAISVYAKALNKRDGAAVAALMATARRAIVKLSEEELQLTDELKREGMSSHSDTAQEEEEEGEDAD